MNQMLNVLILCCIHCSVVLRIRNVNATLRALIRQRHNFENKFNKKSLFDLCDSSQSIEIINN